MTEPFKTSVANKLRAEAVVQRARGGDERAMLAVRLNLWADELDGATGPCRFRWDPSRRARGGEDVTLPRAWWRKWKPTTRDRYGRAFWIGVGSIFDLSGQQTRRNLEELNRDRRRARRGRRP